MTAPKKRNIFPECCTWSASVSLSHQISLLSVMRTSKRMSCDKFRSQVQPKDRLEIVDRGPPQLTKRGQPRKKWAPAMLGMTAEVVRVWVGERNWGRGEGIIHSPSSTSCGWFLMTERGRERERDKKQKARHLSSVYLQQNTLLTFIIVKAAQRRGNYLLGWCIDT